MNISICPRFLYLHTSWESIRLSVSHFHKDHYYTGLKWLKASSYGYAHNDFIRFLHLHTITRCSQPLNRPEIRTTYKTDEESTPGRTPWQEIISQSAMERSDTTVCLSQTTSQTTWTSSHSPKQPLFSFLTSFEHTRMRNYKYYQLLNDQKCRHKWSHFFL